MTFLIHTISKILGIEEHEVRILMIKLLDRLDPVLTYVKRIVLVSMVIYSLIVTPIQGVLLIILGYFICALEDRVEKLEDKLEDKDERHNT